MVTLLQVMFSFQTCLTGDDDDGGDSDVDDDDEINAVHQSQTQFILCTDALNVTATIFKEG
jgi:hypothetical protein